MAGYEDLNDAQRLSTDPTFRLIGSPTRWDRSAALTSTLHWFETELLTREENLVGLMAVNRSDRRRRSTDPTARCSTWIPARARCMGTRRLFGAMLRRIWALPVPTG